MDPFHQPHDSICSNEPSVYILTFNHCNVVNNFCFCLCLYLNRKPDIIELNHWIKTQQKRPSIMTKKWLEAQAIPQVNVRQSTNYCKPIYPEISSVNQTQPRKDKQEKGQHIHNVQSENNII